jgi:hypothetical protein
MCIWTVCWLKLQSEETLEPNSNLSPKFWKDTIPIECVKSHLKTLYLRELQGNQNEFDFLMFIAENAQKLERMLIVLKNILSYTSREEVAAKLNALCAAKWASKDCKPQFSFSRAPRGGSAWNLKLGSDFSCPDPFCCIWPQMCLHISNPKISLEAASVMLQYVLSALVGFDSWKDWTEF